MLTYDQFFNLYNDKSGIGNTDENKGQCVGIVSTWTDNLGLPHIWGNACELYANADTTSYTKIENTPDAIPQAGDIIVWKQEFNGNFGHTGIATGKGDINTFDCFEQNDPLNSPCHVKTYPYDFVIGWLRPYIPPTDSTTLQQLQQQLQQEITAVNQCQTQLQTANNTISSLQPKIDDLTKQLSDVQSKYNAEQEEVITLNEALSKLTSTNKDYATQAYNAQKKETELGQFLDAIAAKIGIKIEGKEDDKITEEIITNIADLQNQVKSLTQDVANEKQLKQQAITVAQANIQEAVKQPGFWSNVWHGVTNWVFTKE